MLENKLDAKFSATYDFPWFRYILVQKVSDAKIYKEGLSGASPLLELR